MSSLEVVGHRVLISPKYEDAEIKDGALKGFDLSAGGTSDTFKRELGATSIGTVVGIGPNAFLEFKSLGEDGKLVRGEPWCNVGDVVYYARYSGKLVENGDEQLVIINDEDVQCLVHEVKEDIEDGE